MRWLRHRIVVAILVALVRLISGQDPAPNVIDALAGLKTQLNTVNSTADLLCESSRMVVNITFARPFRGRIFAENDDKDRRCWLQGTGSRTYQYIVPLKECGTRQISLREFENTLQVRYGPNTDVIQLEDERKTILCRYPPPVVPPIVPVPPPVPAAVPPIPKASVSELELLLIIAAVLFLGLLLLGLCCAWWCCKRRKAAAAVENEGVLIEGAEVMKLSGTTVPFFRIPRVTTGSGAGSDVSESALIQRLDDTGSGEIFPIVPHADNEVLRIPHVTQLSKGYELQEASMIIPEGGGRSVNSEGEAENHTTITELETERRAVFVPPLPQRPPSPSLQRDGPFGPLQGSERERESGTNVIETTTEHTLVATRRPELPYDLRSTSEMMEDNAIRRPAPKLPPKMTTTELETESHSVTESLENELILRAVPKRQQRLMPAPYYPLDTTTETIVEERLFPPRQPPLSSTESAMQRISRKPRLPPPPEPPATTTTTNVTETNIRRVYDIYPEGQGQPPAAGPPSRLTVPPPQGLATTTRTTNEVDIRREYEYFPPEPVPPKPPVSVAPTRTNTETDIRREYQGSPRQPVQQYPPVTTTRTTSETDIRREYESFPTGPVSRPPVPVSRGPPPTSTTSHTTRETDIRREFDVFPAQPPFRPAYQPPVSKISTTNETDIRREYEVFGSPSNGVVKLFGSDTARYPRQEFRQPDTSTTRTVTEEHQEYDEYLEPRFPDGKGPVTFASQSDVRRSNSRLLPEEPGYTSSATTYDSQSARFGPQGSRPHERFISTATRNAQKELDIGTPPESLPPGGRSGPPSVTDVRTTARFDEFRRELDVTPPTFIPRPVLREPWNLTKSTATVSTIRHDLPQSPDTDYPQARPTFRPFSRTPEVPVRRDHLVWTDIQRVLQESPSGYLNPAHRNYLPSESVETLQDLIEFDEDFNVSMTRVRKVYDLYYIRYSSPYDTYFHPTTWTVVIQIFVEVLHLPSPHPGDAEFIEPQPEWFTLPAHSSDRSSDNGSNSTLTPSYIDRAMSEFSEDVPRMMPSRRMLATDGSEAGSSNFGSAPRRGSEYSASERSVSEYTENAPTTTYSRTVREERSSRQFGGNR